MNRLKTLVSANPLPAVLIAAAVGGVLALAFGAVAKLLRPIAKAIPGSKA